MEHPVDTASWSVCSVCVTQSGKPAWAQAGPVVKAFNVPDGVSCSAQKRDSPSPLLNPQPHPRPCSPMNDSLSSATYRPTSRLRGATAVLANVASRYITPPVVKSHP